MFVSLFCALESNQRKIQSQKTHPFVHHGMGCVKFLNNLGYKKTRFERVKLNLVSFLKLMR